jgi:hypothetical protein
MGAASTFLLIEPLPRFLGSARRVERAVESHESARRRASSRAAFFHPAANGAIDPRVAAVDSTDPPKEVRMIGYVTLGTNDSARAAKFYDALFAEIGGKRLMEMDTFIAWGTSPTGPMVSIIKPFDGNQATVGNGVMIALAVDSPKTVQKLHAKALALGGKDEGAPGPRGDGGFYAGYFRDLDGNKLNAFCMQAASAG